MSRFVYEICFACMWMPWFNHPKDKFFNFTPEFSYLLQELKLLQNPSMTQTEEIDSVMT